MILSTDTCSNIFCLPIASISFQWRSPLYSPPQVDRMSLWVYDNQIPIYPIFYLLKGDYRYAHTCIYVYMYICIYVYMYTYIWDLGAPPSL